MKRFVFRLEVLLKVKLTLEKEQKAKLHEIQELLRALTGELRRMQDEQAKLSDEYREESSSGITGDRLRVFGLYFDHMREAIKEQNKRIEEARAERMRRQAVLLRTMKEIKALKKLREAQYTEYLAEVAREEEKAIGDIVSFKAAAGEMQTI